MGKDIDGNRLIREICSITLLCVGIFFILSLYSYSPRDPSFNVVVSSQGHIHNMGGIIGAYIAGICVQMLGLLSWCIPLMCLYSALIISFPRRRPLWYRAVGMAIILICLLIFLSSPLSQGLHVRGIRGGGLAGSLLYSILERYLSKGGIIILEICLLIIGVQLLVCFLWGDIFSTLRGWLNISPKLKRNEPFLGKGEAKKQQPLSKNRTNKGPSREKSPSTKSHTIPHPSPLHQGDHQDLGIPGDEIKDLSHLSYPPPELLDEIPQPEEKEEDEEVYEEMSERLLACLRDFGIEGELLNVQPGPVVTMFEFRPAPGIKISRIANLNNDLALALKAVAIRIEAPIPGKDYIGIEVPNRVRRTVFFKEIIDSSEFREKKKGLPIVLGKDIAGGARVYDLSSMPHLLVAGATGAGKSVCLNSIIVSLLMKFSPEELKFLLIDPKRIELASYTELPHLIHPVVTEMDLAKTALEWAVAEMERRYDLMAKMGVRNISSYNARSARISQKNKEEGPPFEPIPYLVLIIDEMADLMLTAGKEAETHIIRLAQLARAAGIHLILATQRPSVDVVTGLIKANFPARIAFQVTSKHDSRTILDSVGAENLLGKGDMLFKPPAGRIERIHGAYISDGEIERVIEFWKRKCPSGESVDLERWKQEEEVNKYNGMEDTGDDPLYNRAVEFVMEQGRASISMLQRYLRIGFNRAARYVEQMEKEGIIGPADGSKPRVVLKKK